MNRTVFIKAGMSVCAVLAMLTAAQTRTTRYDDEWRMKRSDNSGKVHFTIERSRPGSRWNSSSDVQLTDFRGLSLAALEGSGPAKFEFVRDAARLMCTGQFANGRGIGTFQLIANPQYASDLQRLGYQAPSEDQIFSMMMTDVSIEFARGVKEAGIASTTKRLLEMRIHGVSVDYIQRMRASGYTTLTAPDYVEMRIHGVTPELVTELKRAGYDVPAKKVVEMRIHGVTPAYISELNTHGLKPTASEIVEMRIHGVTPELVGELKRAGYDVSPKKVVEMRIHGVTPAYIAELKSYGLNPTAAEIVQMRIHGITGDYLRKLRASGFQNLTPEKIVKMRVHGID